MMAAKRQQTNKPNEWKRQYAARNRMSNECQDVRIDMMISIEFLCITITYYAAQDTDILDC
jgi:hypothetical protein